MKITVIKNNKIENFGLKEIHLICQKHSNNKVIPSSIHHAKNINITAFVVYIFNIHFFFLSFVYYVYLMVSVFFLITN